MGRPVTRPPASAAAREVTSIRPPYPPVITVQPWAAMAAPICSAGRQRGSGGDSRADPMTATVRLTSPGDELIAAHPLLAGQGNDGTAQHPFGVLAARVDGQRPADPSLAARLVDVAVQAQHRLVLGQRVPYRGGADPGDHRHAALHDRAELR